VQFNIKEEGEFTQLANKLIAATTTAAHNGDDLAQNGLLRLSNLLFSPSFLTFQTCILS